MTGGAAHFSTDDVGGRGRFDYWRSVIGEHADRTAFERPRAGDFRGEMTAFRLGTVGALSISSENARYARGRSICGKADDALIALIVKRGEFAFRQPDGPVLLSAGSLMFTRADHLGALECGDSGATITLFVPAEAVRPFVHDSSAPNARFFAPGAAPTRLLIDYCGLVLGSPTLDAATADLSGRHIADLLIGTNGSLRSGGPEALGRGARAARLRLAKAEIERRLDEFRLNAARIGAQMSVSGRAVQMSFEADGMTFSAYVRERRLVRALEALRDPRRDHVPISQIAYDSGFADLSHFNRCFRRRFGDTPTGARCGS